MTSEAREIVHDQHEHPGARFYLTIGAILIFFTVLEILAYVGETKNMYGPGAAAIIILALSAVKFLAVVMYYMHLKFDHKLFTGIFVFPAALGILVIGSMIILFHGLHGTATYYHGTASSNEAVHGAATTPSGNPEAPTTPPADGGH
ncbi:MAG TPA: cytochrome C oxidase subunit IV family protein [Longimicrobium sp.]|nr:cytochrome C oxidase subunit IV family protein [Longimicrobium sp.]